MLVPDLQPGAAAQDIGRAAVVVKREIEWMPRSRQDRQVGFAGSSRAYAKRDHAGHEPVAQHERSSQQLPQIKVCRNELWHRRVAFWD